MNEIWDGMVLGQQNATAVWQTGNLPEQGELP